MQTLNQDIREKTFKRVYLLYGEEGFLKKSYKNRLKEAVLGDDTMNFHYFEGKGIDCLELISLANTLPFLAEKRLLIIEESGFFKSSSEELASFLPNLPDSTCMIFIESEVDKRGKMFKAVKKYGYTAELSRQNTSQLAKWAAGILAKEGKKITSSTMEFFLSCTGDDMENIHSELDKLISYTWGRESVTKQDIEEVCTVQISNQIFELIRAISDRRTDRAVKLYEDLLILRESPMRILFLLARQFNQILQAAQLRRQGKGKAEIASALNIPSFAAGRLMVQANAFSQEQLLSYVQDCVETEEAIKQGRLSDRIAVELLICKKD